MSKRLILPHLGLLLAFSISSCGDDPELVRKRDEQRAEIRKLEGELSLLREQLKDIPEDRTAELIALKKQVEDERNQIANLEQSIADLESEKRRKEREYAEYQRKYQLR